MKEHIYTIALTDALDKESECLLCTIEKKTDSDAVSYYTGAAMMEPQIRCETNKKGFCPVHYQKMKEEGNTLSVALVLQTRIMELSKMLNLDEPKKRGLFGKKNECTIDEKISSAMGSCAVCDRVSGRMEDCIDNFLYLLSSEGEFKERFFASKGLCMKHFEKVLSKAHGNLYNELVSFQKKEMDRMLSEVNRFVEKFDYRNADMPWENAKDAPERAILKLRGDYDGKF